MRLWVGNIVRMSSSKITRTQHPGLSGISDQFTHHEVVRRVDCIADV